MSTDSNLYIKEKNREFFGNVYFFSSFDIGEEIDIKSLHDRYTFARRNTFQSQYFKSYHRPLILDIEQCDVSEKCESAHLYNFGVLSLRYRFQFHGTLEKLKNLIHEFDASYQHKAIDDARNVFNQIKDGIRHPRFFHLHNSYTLVQIDTQDDLGAYAIKEQHGGEIAAVLRFEHDNLSEYKKDEILSSAFGYYRGDLLVIDYDSALVYDSDYRDLLDIFEFANMRHMELQYFDRILDKQLNLVYERQPYNIPLRAYFPLFGMFNFDPIGELSKLKVDISVVSERLGSSIKFSEEPYYKEVYSAISDKLDFKSWQESLDKKLEIVHDILEVHQNRVASVRYDLLNILVIVLIFTECVLGLLAYVRK